MQSCHPPKCYNPVPHLQYLVTCHILKSSSIDALIVHQVVFRAASTDVVLEVVWVHLAVENQVSATPVRQHTLIEIKVEVKFLGHMALCSR
jgi:hypothetical protein